MEEMKPKHPFKKFPALPYIAPLIGGFAAWYVTQVVALGLFVGIGGLILNYLQMKRKR